MNLEQPILKHFLDDDLYKFTQGQVIFHHFSDVIVQWKFINRGKTQFPPGFDSALKHQLKLMSNLALTRDETYFLYSLSYMRPSYVDWLKGYRLDPDELDVMQEGGDLTIGITGTWYRVIFWEVKLMAVISELYFMMTGQKPDDFALERMGEKGYQLESAGCLWNDFGTRRRFSFDIQDQLVQTMKGYKGFLGTSNVFLAMKHKVKPIGTSAHEFQMGLSAGYGVSGANRAWLKVWSDFYKGELGIALTDTFTTDVFLKDFDSYYARLFDGVRHDSSDPFKWGFKMLLNYRKLDINPIGKKFIFSDNLNVKKYIEIHNEFKSKCIPIAGIGTHFTNDVGVKPMNMVIKMTTASFLENSNLNPPFKDVVKLSDEVGKYTGTPEAILAAKRELGIS